MLSESGSDAELLGVSPGSKLFTYGTLVVLGGLRASNGSIIHSWYNMYNTGFN